MKMTSEKSWEKGWSDISAAFILLIVVFKVQLYPCYSYSLVKIKNK